MPNQGVEVSRVAPHVRHEEPTEPDVARSVTLAWLSEHGAALIEAAQPTDRAELRRSIIVVKHALAGRVRS